MKYRYAIPIFIVAFLIQSTVLRSIAILGTSPNLLLCLVIVFSFLYEEQVGLVLGAFFGAAWDICFGMFIGVSGISFIAASLGVMLLKNYLNHEHVIPAFFASILGTIINSVVFWGINMLLGAPQTVTYVLSLQPILIGYNVIFVIILHLIFVRDVIKHRRDNYYKGNFKAARGLKI